MTLDQRVEAMQGFGFTHRQAAFLTTVMLQSGVCMPRQYTSFCGIKWGHNARDFFGRLTSRGYATAHHCWRKGGAFYHVHHKGLYRAIGEPDNRHRRRISIGRAAERLMILDVVLSHPDVEWLATEQEKVGYFLVTRSVLQTDLPSISFGEGDRQTVRYFTEKLPIGCGPRYEEVVFARDSGRSMYDALTATGFSEAAHLVDETSIRSALSGKPELVKVWLRYSEDKRASSGWYIRRSETSDYEVGHFPDYPPGEQLMKFADPLDACAAYVNREIQSIMSAARVKPRR